MLKKLAWLGLVVWLVGGWLKPLPALAHAGLVRSFPPDRCTALEQPQFAPDDPACLTGEVLEVAPTTVHLWFSEPVQAVRHGIVIIGPAGKPVEQGKSQADGQELQIGLSATERGTYQVYWQAISDDTHPVRGHFAFSVGQTSLPVAGKAAPPTVQEFGSIAPLGLVLQTLGRWLHFAGLALGFGTVAFLQGVLGPARPSTTVAEQRLWRLVNLGIILLVLAAPVALLGQTGSLGLAQLFDIDLAGDMLASSFGRVLAQQVGAAVLLWVLAGPARQGSSLSRWAILLLGVVLCLGDGQSSHAVSSGPLLPGLAANTLHLAAMTVWVGGLVSLLAIWNLPELKASQAEMLRRFGQLAALSLVALVLSGTLLAWLHLNRPFDLVANTYGRTLLLKLITLVGVVGLVWAGGKIISERRSQWWLVELGTLAGLLSLAGLLVSLPPPA